MTARKTSVGGFTGELVSRVALSGDPIKFRGWYLSIDDIMRRTTGRDWVYNYMRLKPAAADRIAAEIRAEMPWADIVYEGELLPARIPTPAEIVPRLTLVGRHAH